MSGTTMKSGNNTRKAPLSSDSLIAFTLEQMNARLAEQAEGDEKKQLRSGLLYLGNVHDAIPRQLILDTRLSPLDKMAWIMIRLYAQQNAGAVFPTYDELQLQLASPHSGKASRETVSRVLLMLRITGWLSLCKRVRDEKGRVKGNIYAQHDEPLTFHDAEALDPNWLDTVGEACRHKNRVISQTAWSVLMEVKDDPMMRHRRSRIALLENRLGQVQTPQQMAALQAISQPSSVTEFNTKTGDSNPSSATELSLKSTSYDRVRQSNGYVRHFTQSVNKNTYVAPSDGDNPIVEHLLPVALRNQLSDDDIRMLTEQLQALPSDQRHLVLDSLRVPLENGSLKNPVGYLLTLMKRARQGELRSPGTANQGENPGMKKPVPASRQKDRPVLPEVQRKANPAVMKKVIAEIRQNLMKR
ncbi:helix-turn-helix domain-containing protein [Photorhabdus noenieputensis]|uniref:STY4528 family pathogenicity island replication protein n=1 Tax=Photorhabdus noenieputensis TaxID=1208607 RepID=UPI001BD54223|nr:STY4528 family pathogenicity island replication protein [Photorhabdus noenieputensis]MBS9439613.1 helix-turn-helix domain-containing protein [Photorhabdus noenieputensis]MCK3668895.1 STY4528 family pathogenicity island replication protein [Photorhabdus noenieputensis]